jgi:hypothetical protein
MACASREATRRIPASDTGPLGRFRSDSGQRAQQQRPGGAQPPGQPPGDHGGQDPADAADAQQQAGGGGAESGGADEEDHEQRGAAGVGEVAGRRIKGERARVPVAGDEPQALGDLSPHRGGAFGGAAGGRAGADAQQARS